MNKIIILGAGAAPGVPSVCRGWGNCNPNNPKNLRSRTDAFIEINGTKILIDTSPDIRDHMLNSGICSLDAVLYTHSHADHLHGIDDLREINRINMASLNIYANAMTAGIIKKRFSYLVASPKKCNNVVSQPSLIVNKIKANKEFYVNDVKIMPLKLKGHNSESIGYSFNDGELVYIADFKTLSRSAIQHIQTNPKVLVMPLTTPYGQKFHAGLSEVNEYIELIKPQRAILNHMASECDYDAINAQTASNVEPAYDNMVIEF